MTIINANIDHLEDLVPLLDGYRVFYRQTSNTEAARQFLLERFRNRDSVVFIAYLNEKAIGFTQLFYSFSTVALKPIFILNDLFIDPNYRGQGVGEALIDKTKNLCRDKNFKGLAIQTEKDNRAQSLYKRLGFELDTDLQFFWKAK